MVKQNGYAQYQNSRIMTASPAELTLMLYEGAIKFCNIAEVAIDEKDIEKTMKELVKATEEYVEELRTNASAFKYTFSLSHSGGNSFRLQ